MELLELSMLKLLSRGAEFCVWIVSTVYPPVIEAHPSRANQFSLAHTYGGVIVLE